MRASLCVVCAIAPIAWGQCEPEEFAKLDPSDPVTGNDFGLALAISGDAILVGARRADGDQVASGAAYVYRFDGVSWVEEAKLTAPDGVALDQFGQSVALSDDAAFIGAPGRDASGAVFVYEFDEGVWMLVDMLTAADAEAQDVFGASVALSGDRLVVGATREDEAGTDAGAAYVFELVEGTWTETAKLLPDDAGPSHGFGIVDVEDDVIAVGAPGASDGAGRAYVFRLVDDAWMLEETFSPKELDADDAFSRVSIWQDLLVVGAPGDDETDEDAGAAYVFRFDGESWVLETTLLASDGAADDRFGNCVHVDGAIVLVGANLDDDNGGSSGSAYIFRNDGGTWVEDDKILPSDGSPSSLFGGINDSIATQDGTAVIGAPSNGSGFGGAYVYETNCPTCPADFNGDGVLGVLDFVFFQLAWVAKDPSADCDENGNFNVFDFVCFQKIFVAGCD